MRALLVFLVLANLGFLFWTLSPHAQSERDPARASREVHPQAITISPVQATGAGSVNTVCLVSGPYTASEIGLLEVAVSSVASPGSWTKVSTARPGQWVLYLGPFADKESLARKEKELKRNGVSYELVTERGQLDLGFLLGRFGTLEAANAELENGSGKALLRTARVVNLVLAETDYTLRIEAANAVTEKRLRSIKLGLIKPFEVCPP